MMSKPIKLIIVFNFSILSPVMPLKSAIFHSHNFTNWTLFLERKKISCNYQIFYNKFALVYCLLSVIQWECFRMQPKFISLFIEKKVFMEY